MVVDQEVLEVEVMSLVVEYMDSGVLTALMMYGCAHSDEAEMGCCRAIGWAAAALANHSCVCLGPSVAVRDPETLFE